MNLHVWILLGGADTRKGSTIRALTGIGGKHTKPFQVMLTSGQIIQILVRIMSVNEGESAVAPKAWVEQFTKETSPQNLIVAFRLRPARNNSEAEDYIRELVRAGAIIESIITLGETTPDWVAQFAIPNEHIFDTKTTPTNAIAHKVRQFWHWL
jgi:hypothetical protein